MRPNDTLGDTSFVAGFSPDGRWLISGTGSGSGHQYHFWHAGTWDLGRRIDQERHGLAWRPPEFTGDGRLMALAIAPDQVLLADAATGREVVRLTTLRPVIPTPMAFSPDGTKLVAATVEKTALIWDLRRIRDQLASRGLDWDDPPYLASTVGGAETAAGAIHPPRRVRVVGAVLEPQARRQAERAEMDRRLAANPDDAEALIHRGWLSLTERRPREAIADLDRGRQHLPGDPDAERMLTQAYLDDGNLAGAYTSSSRAIERTPEDHETRFERGLSALALGLTQQAADDFDRVLAADPTRTPARYHRAGALNRLGRHREALADLDTLIVGNPGDFALYQLRSTAHEALGHAAPARLDREKALSLLPADPKVLRYRAWVLMTGPILQRDPERAVLMARQALALAPDPSMYFNALGLALYRVGRHAEAVDVLERSLRGVRARRAPSTSSSWRWPTTCWGIPLGPEPASIGPWAGPEGDRIWCRLKLGCSTPSAPRPRPCWPAPVPTSRTTCSSPNSHPSQRFRGWGLRIPELRDETPADRNPGPGRRPARPHRLKVSEPAGHPLSRRVGAAGTPFGSGRCRLLQRRRDGRGELSGVLRDGRPSGPGFASGS